MVRWRLVLVKVLNGDLIVNFNIIGSSFVVGVGLGGGGVVGNFVII